MHVISRKKDESLVIGENIIITVIEIRGDKVRLGIECPPDIPFHRKEVYDAIRRHDTTSPMPPAAAPSPPQPHFAASPSDRLDKFVAVLEVKLGVPITRELVLQALREAGIEELQLQALMK